MSKNENPSASLTRWVGRHVLALSIAVWIIQAVSMAADFLIYPENHALWFMIPGEIALPWVLLPLFRLARKKMKGSGDGASLAMLGDFALVLGILVLLALLAFKIFVWTMGGHFNGGIYYFASVWLSGLWAFLP